jgi:hypothetical protein
MRFWSKGLGERELDIELENSIITKEEGNVVMRGILKAPVKWNYEITLFGEDVGGLLRVMISIPGIVYFLKNITGVGTFITKRGQMGSQPADTKPDEKKTVEVKATESKPAETKPAEVQLPDAKPAEAEAKESAGS